MAASSAVGSSSRALAHVMASTQAPGPGGGAPSGVATAQAPVPEQVHLPPAAKRNANGPDAEVTEAALSNQACLLVVVGANSRVVLRMLLARAFRSCGTLDAEARSRTMVHSLADLGINDVPTLVQALRTPEALADLRQLLRGMLLPALRRALNWHRVRHGLLDTLRAGRLERLLAEYEARLPRVEKLVRTLELVLADVTQLSAIDQVTQSFHASLFIILRFRGGALDSDLIKDYDGFPLDAEGRPTFRPSARWFLRQIEFPNGSNLQLHETKVLTAGDDLKLILRLEGDFFERFQLRTFPFDVQNLTVTLSVKCATNGMMPLELSAAGASCKVLTQHFAYADVWELEPTLHTELALTGTDETRRFPAVHLRAMVRRRPGFVLTNVAVPSLAISGLPALTFAVEVELVGDKMAISFAILLTAVTFKFVTAQYLPQAPPRPY